MSRVILIRRVGLWVFRAHIGIISDRIGES
jgi:hypothetical protein